MPRQSEIQYPLISYQRDIWMQQEITGKASAYNLGLVAYLPEEISKEKLTYAIHTLIKEHTIFSLQLTKKEGEICQCFRNVDIPVLNIEDWSHLEKDDVIQRVEAYFERPFDTLDSLLWAYILCRLKDGTSLLIMKYHHILMDGQSIYSIYDRLFKLYYNEESIRTTSDYTKLIERDIKYSQSMTCEKDEAFWKHYLGKEREALFDGTIFKDTKLKVEEIKIEKSLYTALQTFATTHQTSLYHLLIAAIMIEYSKLKDKSDLLVGLTVHSRKTKKIKEILGYYLNEIPFKITINPKDTVLEFIECIRNDLFEVYRHSELATGLILEGQNVDFNINYQQYHLDTKQYEEKGWKLYNKANKSEEKVLVFHIRELDDTYMTIEVEYQTHLFGDEAITKKVIYTLPFVLEQIRHNPVIQSIEITKPEERQQLKKWNATELDKDATQTVYHLIKNVARSYPEAVALIDCEKKVSYGELIESASCIANGLIQAGVQIGDKVGLYLDKKTELVSCMLAIWQVGAAYVPIDKTYPKERIHYLIEDSGIKHIIVDNLLPQLTDKTYLFINQLLIYPPYLDEVKTSPNQLAYMIYTSGTTGMPKGVLIQQFQLANVITCRQSIYTFNLSHQILQIFSHCFDGFLAGTFTPLIAGATVVMPNDEEAKDPMKIKYYMTCYPITHTVIVPSFLKVVLSLLSKEDMSSLKVIAVAGERSSKELIQLCEDKSPQAEIINEYGPTEATILATLARHITSHEIDCIGKPLDNTKIYVLNQQMNQMPVGIPGELWISGTNVSCGYLGRETLTKERFIQDPFTLKGNMYKTGDRGRWLPNGTIEYCDRLDYQVKIRGYRIELREIEEQIKKVESITDCVTIDLGEAGNKYLCAYYVATAAINEETIKAFLKDILPSYMIPTYIIQIEKMPLSSNGKIDRAQLPLPNVQDRSYDPPVTETEKLLEQLLLESIKVTHIGRNENLFELGAHSLILAQFVTKIYKEISKEISLQFVFEHPTIEHIVREIEKVDYVQKNIIKQEKKAFYELTSAQKRLFIIYKWQPDSLVYNVPILIKLSSSVDRLKLEEAFKEAIRRNEGLRTYFKEIEGIPKQGIYDSYAFKLEEVAVTGDLVEAAKAYIKPFNLEKDLLIRAAILHSEHDKMLFLDIHHIIADGTSIEILLSEVMDLYEGRILPEKAIQLSDYTQWENALSLDEQEAYWLKQYEDMPPALMMPLDYIRAKEQSFKGEWINETLSKSLEDKLKHYTKQHNTTMQMLFIAAYSILISKYTRQEDLVIGIPSLGRGSWQLEDMIGMFAKTLPLRMKPIGDLQIGTYLEKVKTKVIEGVTHEAYPLEMLIKKLNIEREEGRNPLFDTMFAYQNKMERFGEDRLFKDQVEIEHTTSKFDFSLTVKEEDEGYSLLLEYCSDLYRRSTMQHFLKHYIYIVEQIVSGEVESINEIEVSLQDEREMIFKFNQTDRNYSASTLVKLFEEAVSTFPERIAVVDKNTVLTYRQLNNRANQVAHYLMDRGIQIEDKVALHLSRSTDTAIGALGILKAGAAYMPIDKSCPKTRLEYMLEDSKAKYVLNEETIKQATHKNNQNPNLDIQDHHLAYVIYTSGTTGMPKGAMLEHGNIVNLLHYEKEVFHVNEKDYTLALLSPSFDPFVMQFFGTLTTGGCVILPDEEEGKDILAIKKYMSLYQVTNMVLVPSLFAVLIEGLSKEDVQHMRFVVLGGEKTSKKIMEISYEKNPNMELVNAYGPTETTVLSTMRRFMDAKKQVSIGVPVANTKVFVVNQYGQMLPPNLIGEIAITGKGLARGYLGKETLTNKKFVQCPFLEHERMYLTGDLGKWNDAGEIEFYGRLDDQVKIRGFRIELQEIEVHISKLPYMKEVCVIVKGDTQKYLCAYFTAKEKLEESLLKETLAKTLPEYMVPAYFMQLDKLPVTVNGKVNKAKLPDIVIKQNQDYSIPKTEEEKIIYKVWKEVLGSEGFSTADSFFYLGGDSIKSIQVAAKLIKLGYEVETRAIMRYPTIKQLAQQLTKVKSVQGEVEVEGSAPLTPIQNWFFNQAEDKYNHFNQSLVLESRQKVDAKALMHTCKKLLQTHDALRMRFYQNSEGKWEQHNPAYTDNFSAFYIWEVPEYEDQIHYIRSHVAKGQSTLDIEKGEVLRVDLFRTSEKDYISIIMHHLVEDAVSFRILIEDMEEIYTSYVHHQPVEMVKSSSFIEWANRLVDYVQSDKKLQKQRAYWIDIASQIGKDETYCLCEEKACAKVELDVQDTEYLLGKAHMQYQTQINDLLLVALSRAFYKWEGSLKLAIELEGHGREEILEDYNSARTVGWFTTTYPIVIDYKNHYAKHIECVKEDISAVPDKGIGYGLLRYLTPEGNELGCSPRVGFNYLGVMDHAQTDKLFSISDVPSECAIPTSWKGFHEIEFTGKVLNKKLSFNIAYAHAKYDKQQIEELAQFFKDALEQLIIYLQTRKDLMSQVYKAKNIEPFVDVFYKDCFYHAYFPAVQSYGLSIRPYLLNTIASYGYSDIQGGLISKDLEQMPLEELVNQYGMHAEKISLATCTTDQIGIQLAHKKLVIIPVDCYALSYRTDRYLKNHWQHTLLVYGYNQQAGTFNVLDHEDIHSEVYTSRTVSFKDICDAYLSYRSHFGSEEADTYILSKSKKDSKLYEKESMSRYAQFTLGHKERLENNLIGLQRFEIDLKDLWQNKSKEDSIWQEILFNINGIIKSKLAEEYKVKVCFGEGSSLQMICEIVKVWMLIRNKLQRYLLLSQDTQEIVLLIRKAYLLEKQYMNSLEEFKELGEKIQ